MRHAALAACAAALSAPLLAAAAPRQSPAGFAVAASSADEPGWIAFTITGATPGADVRIVELVGADEPPAATFTAPSSTTVRHHGARWRCDRRRRTFRAVETLPDGSEQTQTFYALTPSCTSQLAVSTWPQPARAGRPLDVTVTSTRRDDHRPVRICARRGADRVCGSARLSGATGAASAKLVLGRRGAWRLEATGPGIALTRDLHAGRRALTVLATGDSEIQVLDDLLASALGGRARVVKEAHIATGLSKPGGLNWVARAVAQARAIHPDVTVMSIGANDGFDLPGLAGGWVSCCGQDWVDAYAARAHQMMGSYLRHGAGRVYWFLLPTPRRADFVHFYRAIDAGFAEAAAEFPSGVRVVDIRPIFSPGGSYRQYVGSVNAREADGIHLSVGGDRIALRYLLSQMRHDGTL
jgi:lysophospholipase L1-like esterase